MVDLMINRFFFLHRLPKRDECLFLLFIDADYINQWPTSARRVIYIYIYIYIYIILFSITINIYLLPICLIYKRCWSFVFESRFSSLVRKALWQLVLNGCGAKFTIQISDIDLKGYLKPMNVTRGKEMATLDEKEKHRLSYEIQKYFLPHSWSKGWGPIHVFHTDINVSVVLE